MCDKKVKCNYCFGEMDLHVQGANRDGSAYCLKRLANFCSNTCYHASRIPKPRLCPTCNDIIPLVKGKDRLKYCSRKCVDIENNKPYESRPTKKSGPLVKRILVAMAGGCCNNCGYKKCHRALVFHHIHPSDKLFMLNSHVVTKHSWQEIFLEFEKCQLLCHNCHANLHQKQRDSSIGSRPDKKNKYIKLKLEYLNKFDNKCKSCNLLFDRNNYQTATFHHRYDKQFPLDSHAFLNKNIKELDIEASKCDLLCMNCHSEYHHSSFSTIPSDE